MGGGGKETRYYGTCVYYVCLGLVCLIHVHQPQMISPPVHPPQVSLLLLNASRVDMDFADAALRADLTTMHRVPPAMLEAAEAMLGALVEKREKRGPREGTTVYVAGPLAGGCRICGVERFVGFLGVYMCMGAWVLVVVVATPLSHTHPSVYHFIYISAWKAPAPPPASPSPPSAPPATAPAAAARPRPSTFPPPSPCWATTTRRLRAGWGRR